LESAVTAFFDLLAPREEEEEEKSEGSSVFGRRCGIRVVLPLSDRAGCCWELDEEEDFAWEIEVNDKEEEGGRCRWYEEEDGLLWVTAEVGSGGMVSELVGIALQAEAEAEGVGAEGRR
jgi:hypothetical protein